MARPRGFIANYNPRPKTLALIVDVQAVLAQYVPTYGPMTLRQIFYRLVATAGYPKTELDYKRLSENIGNARRGRMIPFTDIRDDGDVIEHAPGWGSLASFHDLVQRWAGDYTLRGDIGQPVRTILLVEAAGMVPQVARVCAPYGVEVRSASGFDGLTGKYALAENIADTYLGTGRPTRLLHIGDYDPSGVHIFTSLAADVAAFVDDTVDAGKAFLPERIALTEQQIHQFGVQLGIKKVTDNRSFPGVNGDGVSTAQLEALAPPDLARIVEDAILDGWDHAASAALKVQEADDCKQLTEWLAKGESQ